MDIVEHIHELLHISDKFALPGFGYLYVEEIPSAINTSKNEITPPKRIAKFKEDNTASDDILKNFITEKEKITSKKAEEQIKTFVKASRGILKSKEPLKLPKIGRFYLNAQKQILFDSDESANFSLAKETLKSIPLTPIQKEEPNPEPRTKAPPVIKDLPTTKIENKPIEPKEEAPTKKESSKLPLQKKESANEEIKKAKKKRKTLPIVLLFVILILLGLFIWQVATKIDRIQLAAKHKLSDDNKILLMEKAPFLAKKLGLFEAYKQDSIARADSLAALEAALTSSEPTEGLYDSISNSYDGVELSFDVPYPEGKFYIIIGSFTDIANAEDLLAKVDGMDKKIISQDGYHRVSINSYDSIPDVENNLLSTRTLHADAWVLNTEY